MQSNVYTVAPTLLYNHVKFKLCTTPYLELALDRWMKQNSLFLLPWMHTFVLHLDQHKYAN